MGCVSSACSKGKVTHPLVSETAPAIKKIRAYEAIKKNDPILVEWALEEVEPTENLALEGENYTCLHAAAHHNSFQAMEVILSWLKKNRPADLPAILKIHDSHGQIPAVTCIMNDSSESFYVMLTEKTVDFDYQTVGGVTLPDLCVTFSSICGELLEQAQNNEELRQSKLPKLAHRRERTLMDDAMVDSQAKLSHSVRFKKRVKKLETSEKIVRRARTIAKEQQRTLRLLPFDDQIILEGVPKNSKVFKLLCDLARKNGQYSDPDFKPNLNSITKDVNHQYYKQFRNAVWLRPNELFKCDFQEIYLFDTIDPHDIAQGILGVCYLLSSLSALAEFPSRLTQIFLNHTCNKYGVYGLQMYIKGVPTEILVDDYIPCYSDRDQEPLFSKPKGKELWVLLAEKAWAKIFKNYVACEAGHLDEALEYLTGTPTFQYFTENQTTDEIWRILSEADHNNAVICAATHGTVTEEMGLVALHAYSIISAHDAGEYRILKLRNPWGHFEWTGDFSDNSKLWTDELKKQIGYTNADDGLFCMTVEDFKKCFQYYAVGIYQEGWEYSYVESECDVNHAEYFKFSVDQPCDVYLRIHQDDERLYAEDQQRQYKYSSADLILTKIEDDGTYSPILADQSLVHRGSRFGARSIYPSKEHKLEITTAGAYIIRTKIRWNHDQRGKYTLSAYAPVKIELKKVTPIKDYLSQFLKNIALKGEKQDFGNQCTLSYDFYMHYFYLYFENKGADKLVVDITFTKLENLRIDKRFKASADTLQIEVQPGTNETVVIKKIEVGKQPDYEWKFRHKFVKMTKGGWFSLE